jgi:hypothetical protein
MGELPQGFAPPDAPTRLVTSADDLRRFTANQETDARTALTRGLAEYISTLSWDDFGGRQLQFERVFSTWPEAEDEAVYPSACVRATGPGDYDNARLTPSTSTNAQLQLPDGRYVVSPCEYTVSLTLEVRVTDPDARKAVCSMLEVALNPLEWRYGILLELPHYFNQRATMELASMNYVDAEDRALQRLRIAEFNLNACVPVTRLATLPMAKFKTRVEVSPESSVIKGVASRRNC